MPVNTKVRAKILVDIDHIVSGQFCKIWKDASSSEELMWAYSGPDDPIHRIGGNPQFSVIVPMLVKIGDEKLYKNFRGPNQVLKQLMAISKQVPTLRGLIIDVECKEADFRSYTITNTRKIGTVDEDQNSLVKKILESVRVGEADEIEEWLLAIKPDFFALAKDGPVSAKGKKSALSKKSVDSLEPTIEYVEEEL